jgi:hypothetical protein
MMWNCHYLDGRYDIYEEKEEYGRRKESDVERRGTFFL